MKKLIALIFILCCAKLNAQTISRQVFNTTGGVLTTGNTTMRVSVGEPLIGKTGSTTMMLSQGFFTGSFDATSFVYNPTPDAISISVFPNPSSSQISFCGNIASLARIEIYNCVGQKIYFNVIGETPTTSDNKIDVASFSSGLFLILFLNSNNEIISSSKFIKN